MMVTNSQEQTQGTPRSVRSRGRKPLAVTVVEQATPIDFARWADQLATVVVRLYREDLQQREAA